MFSSLRDVRGAHVLDLFAGSGALGIEALSRGAASVVFVERAGPALGALRRNLRDLGVEAQGQVLATPVARAVRGFAGRRFDLVFADPPYAVIGDAAATLTVLWKLDEALAPAARLVVEHASRDPAPVIAGVVPERVRRYGDTSVSFYAFAPQPGPVPDC